MSYNPVQNRDSKYHWHLFRMFEFTWFGIYFSRVYFSPFWILIFQPKKITERANDKEFLFQLSFFLRRLVAENIIKRKKWKPNSMEVEWVIDEGTWRSLFDFYSDCSNCRTLFTFHRNRLLIHIIIRRSIDSVMYSFFSFRLVLCFSHFPHEINASQHSSVSLQWFCHQFSASQRLRRRSLYEDILRIEKNMYFLFRLWNRILMGFFAISKYFGSFNKMDWAEKNRGPQSTWEWKRRRCAPSRVLRHELLSTTKPKFVRTAEQRQRRTK